MNEASVFFCELALPVLVFAVWIALPSILATPWFEAKMRRRMVRARAQYDATAAAMQAYEQVMDREAEELGPAVEERFERRYGSDPVSWTLEREAEREEVRP